MLDKKPKTLNIVVCETVKVSDSYKQKEVFEASAVNYFVSNDKTFSILDILFAGVNLFSRPPTFLNKNLQFSNYYA